MLEFNLGNLQFNIININSTGKFVLKAFRLTNGTRRNLVKYEKSYLSICSKGT